jgi:Bacterial SH3 domain
MTGLLRAVFALALLGVPVLVVLNMPWLFEAVGSVPALNGAPVVAPTPFRLADPTPTSRARLSGLEDALPPTLAPAPTATALPRPTPTGEQVIVNNTGGIGAVLRAEPVTGKPLASVREQVVLTVIERRSIDGGEWLHVRTPDGQEGWVFGLVARPTRP